MSSSLNWEVVDDKPINTLPTALKHVLIKRHGEPFDIEISCNDMGYIEGLRDAGIDGAAELCKLVETNGRIRLFITY